MEPGSCSRWSWADEVEAEKASLSARGSDTFNLPPMAAAAHATLVLQATSLNPDAEPYQGSPGCSGARLCFTDSEASLSDHDGSPFYGAGQAERLRRQRRRRRNATSVDAPPPSDVTRHRFRRAGSLLLWSTRRGCRSRPMLRALEPS